MDLVLIRHGRPERIERTDGLPADPPLDEIGRRQSRRLAAWLAAEVVDVVVSSPMQRALATARPFAEHAGLPIDVVDGVAEFDRDAPSYVPLEELKITDRPAWEAMMATFDASDPAIAAFRATVVAELDRVVAANAGRTVAVFCHGGVINAWASTVLGLADPFFFQPDYTSINRFRASGSGGIRSVVSLNETPHLPRGS